MEMKPSDPFSSILRCSRYSFGPNRLHYCGPDQNAELQELIENDKLTNEIGVGLSLLLKQFKTLFPYLKNIAAKNQIRDPFDLRVVEAYWIGNELLENIHKQEMFDFLIDDLDIKKKMSPAQFRNVENKITLGTSKPHHNFHVLNIWTQGGHGDRLDALTRMDECRISWGKVLNTNGPEIFVETEPLTMVENKISLGKPVRKKIIRQLEAEYDIEQLVPNQIVSIHWGVPCEVITEKQVAQLRKYTLQSIDLANNT